MKTRPTVRVRRRLLAALAVSLLLAVATRAAPATPARAASTPEPPAPTLSTPSPEAVLERGPHHAVIETTRIETDAQGQSVTVKGRYVQLEDGLNYWDDARQARAEARAEIELVKGVGVARHGQQQVLFAPSVNDPDGAITLMTREGIALRSSILALA